LKTHSGLSVRKLSIGWTSAPATLADQIGGTTGCTRIGGFTNWVVSDGELKSGALRHQPGTGQPAIVGQHSARGKFPWRCTCGLIRTRTGVLSPHLMAHEQMRSVVGPEAHASRRILDTLAVWCPPSAKRQQIRDGAARGWRFSVVGVRRGRGGHG
jgi:hypothetical protein